jgi:hypothetical protein
VMFYGSLFILSVLFSVLFQITASDCPLFV